MTTQGQKYDFDLSGTRIGNYYFCSRIGRGAFADVYLVTEIVLPSAQRDVAIKVSLADIRDRRVFQKRANTFAKDLKCLFRLSEENAVVQYYNTLNRDLAVLLDGSVVLLTDVPKGVPKEKILALASFMIVMEYADGGSLDNAYRNEVIMRGGHNVHLAHFVDICLALQAAHEEEIIHQDIKPGNLLYFRKAKRVKLADFGIAKCLDDITPDKLYLEGSFPYIAPEVFTTKRNTVESDIYALGCTLYELYRGKRAFELTKDVTAKCSGNKSRLADEWRRIHETAERPNALTSESRYLSPYLNNTIKQMMAVDARTRPGIEEIIKSLREEQLGRVASVGKLLEEAQNIRLPSEPKMCSEYIVNPRFRRVNLEEMAFFMFVDMQPRKKVKLQQLLSLLSGYFGRTYSFHEIFGRNDFIIRLWSGYDMEVVKNFIAELKQYVLQGANESVTVMACEEVRYIGTHVNKLPDDYDKTNVLIKFNEVQVHGNEKVAKELLREGIYIRKATNPVGKRQIKCFCLIKSVLESDEKDRLSQTSCLRSAIEDAQMASSKFDVTLYRRAYSSVLGVDNELCDHMITYIAPCYERVIVIPEHILERVPRYEFKTITMLSTKRYIIESDNVYVARGIEKV